MPSQKIWRTKYQPQDQASVASRHVPLVPTFKYLCSMQYSSIILQFFPGAKRQGSRRTGLQLTHGTKSARGGRTLTNCNCCNATYIGCANLAPSRGSTLHVLPRWQRKLHWTRMCDSSPLTEAVCYVFPTRQCDLHRLSTCQYLSRLPKIATSIFVGATTMIKCNPKMHVIEFEAPCSSPNSRRVLTDVHDIGPLSTERTVMTRHTELWLGSDSGR